MAFPSAVGSRLSTMNWPTSDLFYTMVLQVTVDISLLWTAMMVPAFFTSTGAGADMVTAMVYYRWQTHMEMETVISIARVPL